ncbi:MAG: porin [Sulfurimonas sp.]|nr:MAG: porin [Sulfurimonas sp.]
MMDFMSGMLLASAYPLESGQMHSKQAGRYDIVRTLPKESDSIHNMFAYARVEGTLRVASIYHRHEGHDRSAVSVGGLFGFHTAAYQGVNLHVKATTSQYIAWINHDASKPTLSHDFFNATGDSFTYLSHANVRYENATMALTLGRMALHTPYVDTDDIRMAANSFEGLSSHISMTDHIDMQAFYVTRWAGFDSGANQQEFTPLVEDGSGVGALGISYTPNDESSAELWYYYADAMSHILYAEYSGHYNISEAFHLEYGVQGSYLAAMEHANVDGVVLGVMGIVDYGPLFCGLSYNRGFVKSHQRISDGFGAGPYYTSLDEATLGAVSQDAVGEDVMAYRVGVGYEFESIGFVIEAVYGRLRSHEHSVNVKESDVIVSYDITKAITLNASLTAFHSHDDRENFERGLVRVDYNF